MGWCEVMFLSCYLFSSLWFHRCCPIALYIKIVYNNIMLFYYITWQDLDNLVFITIYIFYFYFFSSHIIFYKFLIVLSRILSWKSSYSLSLDFLFFLATLLYIDESLWFKTYFGSYVLVLYFFSFPLQVVSLFTIKFR